MSADAIKCKECCGYWLALPDGGHECKCESDSESEARGPRKIYVASSWRNQWQPSVVEFLRNAGHKVYDFRNPTHGDKGFHWSDIDPHWQQWTNEQYRDKLNHPLAKLGFDRDLAAMKWADAIVAVQPFGRSASLELGWAAGAGKQTILLLENSEPELMVKMCDHICVTLDEVVEALK